MRTILISILLLVMMVTTVHSYDGYNIPVYYEGDSLKINKDKSLCTDETSFAVCQSLINKLNIIRKFNVSETEFKIIELCLKYGICVEYINDDKK